MPNFLSSIRWRWPALGVFAVAALAGCVGLDTQQRKWIFQASVLQTVDDGAHLDGIDDVWITLPATAGNAPSEAVRLHGLWADGPRPDAPLMLYLRREDKLQGCAKSHPERCASGLHCLSQCGLRDGIAKAGQFCIDSQLAAAASSGRCH